MSIVRTNDQKLSLWQSAVAEVARRKLAEEKGAEPGIVEVLEHPLVKATDDFVQKRASGSDSDAGQSEGVALESASPHLRNVMLTGLAFDIARSKIEAGSNDLTESLESSTAWPYTDSDPHFIECIFVYAGYYVDHAGAFLYNDWKTEGKDSLDYGVIPRKLPNNAKVGILGDWGTGMDDARALLLDLVRNHQDRLAAIIHIGDIYYSGTPNECKANFTDIFESVFDEVLGKGKRIPVFTLPGNHDYYALGYGYYPMLKELNKGLVGAEQQASYFCLRSEDNGWQFLGMDTGYHDANPLDQFNPLSAGTWLQKHEIEWHLDKLRHFDGVSVLLSHHQLFSANQNISGKLSTESEFPYLNVNLLNVFKTSFDAKIAAWLWGHEHNFTLFQDGLFGLAKGRLLGASAFEEMESEHPYQVKHPEVPYLDPSKYQLAPNEEGYFGHSYAIVDLAGRAKPDDPVQVSYYAFPSWYKKRPDKPEGTLIYSESFARPAAKLKTPLRFGDHIYLSVEGGIRYLGPAQRGVEAYPTVSANATRLRFIHPHGKSGDIHDGDEVCIQTMEGDAGDKNLLGAWAFSTLYYYSPGYEQQKWTIHKLDSSSGADKRICLEDSVYLLSRSSSGQWLTSTPDAYFTTTKEGQQSLFALKRPT